MVLFKLNVLKIMKIYIYLSHFHPL